MEISSFFLDTRSPIGDVIHTIRRVSLEFSGTVKVEGKLLTAEYTFVYSLIVLGENSQGENTDREG